MKTSTRTSVVCESDCLIGEDLKCEPKMIFQQEFSNVDNLAGITVSPDRKRVVVKYLFVYVLDYPDVLCRNACNI